MSSTSIARILARRGAAAIAATNNGCRPVAAKALVSTFTFRGFSTSGEKVPENDYVNGHLLTDHLEYMEDMLDVTLRMEQSMKELEEVYDKKRQALANMSEIVEIDELFEKAATKKALLSSQIAELKTVLGNARAYATDAPDGTSDAEIRDDVRFVNKIINDASKLEDVDTIRKQRAFDRAVKAERARDPEHDW